MAMSNSEILTRPYNEDIWHAPSVSGRTLGDQEAEAASEKAFDRIRLGVTAYSGSADNETVDDIEKVVNPAMKSYIGSMNVQDEAMRLSLRQFDEAMAAAALDQ